MDFKQPHRQRRPQARPPISTNHHPPLTVSTPKPTATPAIPVPSPNEKLVPPKRSQRFPALSKKRLLISGGIIIVLIPIILLAHSALTRTSQPASGTIDQKPAYQTISPGGRSVIELGGWRRVSPPNAPAVYSYDDSINGVSISVSQQPLPSSFQTNTDSAIAQLAKAYNAIDKLNAGGTTVYVGTSAKGPQSVIFVKNNLLVLVKSQSTIDDRSWKQYVSQLTRSGTDTAPQY